MRNLILILLIVSNSYSQKKILIEYSAIFMGELLTETQKKDALMVERFSGIEDNIETTKFTLTYVDGISIFKSVPKMSIGEDNFATKMASLIASENDIFYKDNQTALLIENTEFDGTIFNITVKTDNNWILKKDSKKIAGFDCLKATKNEKGIEVIAWYCPKLPYSLGPLKYTDLPGIILELERDQIKYIATKINLNYKGKEIPLLPTGKNISRTEYLEIVKAN